MKKVLCTIIVLIFSASLGYSQVTTLWEKSATAGTKPAWETGSTTRGIGYGLVGANQRLFVVNRNAAFGGKQIFIFNATTGDSVGMLDTTGISGGTLPVNDVEVSSDGKIFVCNLAAGGFFKVYKYDSEVAPPVAVINVDATGRRLGDKITITGTTADNSIIIWAVSADADGEVLKFTTTDNGVSFTSQVVNIGTLASFGSAAVGPLSSGDFYFNAQGLNAKKFSSTGSDLGTVPNTVLTTGGSAIRYLSAILGDEYIVANELSASTNNAKFIKVPGGVLASAAVYGTTPVFGTTSAGGLGDVSVQKVSAYVYNIFVLATNNGFGAYRITIKPSLAGDYYIGAP
ncbi:MAG TPA: hypothetical protein VF870_16630, partial [Ignavibacteriaceae bacterium]